MFKTILYLTIIPGRKDGIIVLILDGRLERSAHSYHKIGDFICLGHLLRSKANLKFIKKNYLFFFTRAQRILSYHLIKVPGMGSFVQRSEKNKEKDRQISVEIEGRQDGQIVCDAQIRSHIQKGIERERERKRERERERERERDQNMVLNLLRYHHRDK